VVNTPTKNHSGLRNEKRKEVKIERKKVTSWILYALNRGKYHPSPQTFYCGLKGTGLALV
jgi:hypothetical protein